MIPTDRVYKAAVIGAGAGGRLSMQALSASPRFELVAVADIRAEAQQAAQEQYPHIQTFATYQDLFQAVPLDVVCVSTWATSHLEITRAALKLPIVGLLVEKPLAQTFDDGRTLLAEVSARGLPMVVPHGLLVSAHGLEIIERVHAGEIGELKLVEIQCSGWDIINAGIHWLNFVVVLTKHEAIDWVMASVDTTTRTYRDGLQVETMAVTYAQSQSGLRIVMNTGDYVKVSEPHKSTLFRLVGTQGTLDFYAWESTYRILNKSYPEGGLFEVDGGSRTSHQIHLDNLAQQIDDAKPDYLGAESSLIALEICEVAYLSGKHGCMVKLPLHQFTVHPTNDWNPGQPYSGSGGGRDGRNLPALN